MTAVHVHSNENWGKGIPSHRGPADGPGVAPKYRPGTPSRACVTGRSYLLPLSVWQICHVTHAIDDSLAHVSHCVRMCYDMVGWVVTYALCKPGSLDLPRTARADGHRWHAIGSGYTMSGDYDAGDIPMVVSVCLSCPCRVVSVGRLGSALAGSCQLPCICGLREVCGRYAVLEETAPYACRVVSVSRWTLPLWQSAIVDSEQQSDCVSICDRPRSPTEGPGRLMPRDYGPRPGPLSVPRKAPLV